MDLSIITVTWNSASNIADQIRSVLSATNDISFEHWIVDNASTDSTVEVVEKFTNIKLIKNIENTGFAKANNLAAKQASGDYLLFLNPDMKLEPGSLKKIIDWIREKKEVGVVSCMLVDESGIFNQLAKPRRFPRLLDQLALVLKLRFIFPWLLQGYVMADFNEESEQEVDSVRGSFMLVRKELVEKLGRVFDERYFIWFEDVDLCREAKKHGYKVFYTPIVSCIDLVGKSFSQRDRVWAQKQFTKSMIIYFKKWQPAWQVKVLQFFRPVGVGLVWLDSLIKKT